MAALVLAGAAFAQPYPSKAVKVIVPFGAGGPTDVIARVVAQKLSEAWGQQVVTENVPGAGGNTGVAMAARSPADGYTIVVVSTGFMVNPSMYSKIPYDPVKDFTPVTLVAASPNVISAHPGFPAATLKELIDLVKANPNKYSFAQPSTGSTPHLAGELFKQEYRLDLVTVPFNSAALAINSTIGGHTPIAFTALPPAMTNIREGKLRGLAVLSARRAPALPDVPTNAEAGVPGLESDTLTGIVAPAGTPRQIIERWRNEIVKIVALPEVKQRLEGSASPRSRIRRRNSANASRSRWRDGARWFAMPTSRRIETPTRMTRLAGMAAFCAALLATGIALAQSGYPNRPVRLVAPFAPGGPVDVVARILAPKLAEGLGQQFYVENHPGASGNLGTALVAKAPGDGHTILVTSSTLVVNPSLFEKLGFDTYKDLAPVSLVGVAPQILLVHPSVPATSVKELVDWVKANPGQAQLRPCGPRHAGLPRR